MKTPRGRTALLHMLILGAGLLAASTAMANSPASVLVRVFEMRASKNSDCSNAASIFKTTSPTVIDLVNNPTIGTGVIPDQTFHCIMFHVSDLVTVVPQSTDASCTAGQSYTFDMFKDPSTDQSINPDNGSIITGTNGEDDPWIYFSDSPVAAATNSCFQPVPINCACSGPCPLSAFQVLTDQTRSLVINFDNKLGDFGNGVCTLHPPALSIR